MIQYNNFLMKREQSRAGSRFAECEKSRLKAKILITLALLLTAVTGAWADGTVTVTEIKASEMPTSWGNNSNPVKATDLPGFTAVTRDEAKALGAPAAEGEIYVFYAISDNSFTGLYWNNGVLDDNDGEFSLGGIYALKDVFKFYYTGSAASTIKVAWDKTTKTGTFTMPAFDVEIDPIYAPVAVFATDGEPTAIKGIIAGEAKDIVKAGIVAKVGSTENAQGTLMYLVTTTKDQPTSTEGFSATVPTGAVLTGSYAEDQTVYVWYYIKGIDAAEGVTPTAENTFNDSEICETPIKVTVLSNKFDIQFNAANANTIEAGKATVKVGDAAAEVKDGKLEGVKMDSKVSITAKEGYKFRKVEVKKKAEVLTITVAKGSTDLSGDKLLYYTPGETYRQAIANHPENKLDGGLGWNIWEGGNDATIFYKESANKARDLSIDGDQHFRPTDSINLDTVIDPTLNFYFVAQF